MNADQFHHVLRAAAVVSGVTEFIVFGSQAVVGTMNDPDPRLTVSLELDICPANDDQGTRNLIDRNIGELSLFHETHGVYAQGVDMHTAFMPAGWRERAQVLDVRDAPGVTVTCPHPADIIASKLARGQQNDHDFAAAALESGAVHADDVLTGARTLVAPEEVVEYASGLARGIVRALGLDAGDGIDL